MSLAVGPVAAYARQGLGWNTGWQWCPLETDMVKGTARGGAIVQVHSRSLGHNTPYIYCDNPTQRTVTVRVKWATGEQNQVFTAGQSGGIALPAIMFFDFSYDGGTYLWASGLEIGFKSVA